MRESGCRRLRARDKGRASERARKRERERERERERGKEREGGGEGGGGKGAGWRGGWTIEWFVAVDEVLRSSVTAWLNSWYVHVATSESKAAAASERHVFGCGK